MKKRLLAIVLCLLLAVSCLSVVASAEHYTQDVIESIDAPSIYAFSSNTYTYVNVIHSEDAMRHIAANDFSYWGDAEGEDSNSDYWWTGYGRGKRYENYVQIDWRLPGSQWHYTTEWDTDLYACEAYIADSTYWWLSDCGAYYKAFYNSDCYNAESDSVFYPLKNHFEEYFDGYDYYYLFDQTKSVQFRCRYIIREESGGYYDNYETEEATRYILSDWSNTVNYGSSGNSQASIPSTLSAPVLENPAIGIGEGYYNANVIDIYSFAPQDIAYLDTLELDIEEISVDDLNIYINFEASIDGINWEKISSFALENLYTLDTSDIWYEFLREDGQSWEDYIWYTRDVYIRACYEVEYSVYDYTTDNVTTKYGELTGPYSNVLRVNVPGVNLYNININYKNYGASNSSRESFVCNENSTIGWIYTAPLEGFYVAKVLVNGNVMFDKDDESTYELLEWYDDDEFRFWDNPLATENLEIDIYFGGTSPVKNTITYLMDENATGTGEVYVSYPDNGETLYYNNDTVQVNQGLTVTLTVKADKGCVINSVCIDGQNQTVSANATEAQFTIPSINADHTIEVSYTRVAYYCYVYENGNGTVSVTEPDYHYDNDYYVNAGDTFAVQATADLGYRILRIKINDQEQNLSAYGDADNLTTADITVENIQEETSIYVEFSSPETQYVTLTIEWNEGGVCNGGETIERVVKGYGFNLYIQPNTGYEVARIIDGDTIIDNFIGDSYYVRDLNSDRKVVIEFVEVSLSTLYGDVNRDGKVTSVDALMVLQIAVGKLEPNDLQKKLGDVNVDGIVSSADALQVLQKSVGKIDKFEADNYELIL